MYVGIALAHQPAFGDRAALDRAAAAAEQLGYASVWVPAAAADEAAAATERIRVGVVLDGDEVAHLEDLDADRLVTVVSPGTDRPVPVGASLLVGTLPSAAAVPASFAGWSPPAPSLAELDAAAAVLAGTPLLLVPRVRVRVTGAVLDGRRAWCGSLPQIAGDVAAALTAGASEVVVALHGRPALDEALGRWAKLAELLEASFSR